MIDCHTQLEKHSLSCAGNERFWETLDRILGAVPAGFDQDIISLLNHWLEFTGASWLWLWLTHRDPRTGKECWEIFCFSSSKGYDPSHYVPPKSKPHADTGMAIQYAVRIHRPVLVKDLKNWTRTHDQTKYEVIHWKELSDYGVKSFLAVPLKFVGGGDGNAYAVLDKISGGICLHFESEPTASLLMPENAYAVLASASVQAISSFFAAKQHRILNKLGVLGAEYLSKTDLKPEDRRREYLRKVCDLIRHELRMQQLSVFYETPDGQAVECIFTTGLADKNERILAEDEWNHAQYRKGKNVTGKVYETGQPHVWQVEEQRYREPGDYIWKEIPVEEEDVDNRAWLAWPIAIPTDPDSTSSKPRVIGVIRCVGNEGFEKDQIRPFDPIQLQTLDFITAQMAPILETMATNIQRELVVNVIKHDLYAPLRVIEDQATRLKAFFETYESKLTGVHLADRRVIEHLPNNVKASVVLARNLAGSLGDQQAYIPEITRLEADIVARLREGLGHFATVENGMLINYRGLRDIPPLSVDRTLVERALCNLLLNAIKYGYYDTDIDVVGETRPDYYAIRVENRGIKIPLTDRDKIFQGNYRGKEAAARKVGLGLGLKIARRAMLQHGGELILESANESLHLTVFTMLFPKRLAFGERFH